VLQLNKDISQEFWVLQTSKGIVMVKSDVESRLSTHEEVCALRYEQINARLKRLEQILLGTAGFVIVFLLTHFTK
jgi:hypothetical protein